MALKRLALVAILAGLALVAATTASARRYPTHFKLSLVPLQKAQLGAAAASFALNSWSGLLPNGPVPLQVLGAYTEDTGPPWQVTGRLSGYALDYGDPLTGSTGVMEIRTGVEKYKSRADAKFGLGFWRITDSELNEFNSSVLPVTEQGLKRPAVGQKGFTSLLTFAATDLNPIVRLDEQVADGRYVLDVTVTAGSASAAEQAAPGLLKALDRRLHRLLAGRSVGGPAKVPYEPEPGQAEGGPDLSAAAFQLSDFGQSHWVGLDQDYVSNPFALSSYVLDASPAGPYDGLQQEITWWPTATEATYAAAYQGELLDGLQADAAGSSIAPVDLSALSDPANGVLMAGSGRSYLVINLTRGQAVDSVFATSDTTLTTSDVQTLAHVTATRLDAALP
jgi:hypothetical protein